MKAHVEDARKALVLVLGKHSRKGCRRAIAWAVSFLFLFYPVAPASLAGPAPAKEATHSTAAASSAQGGCTLNSPRGKVSHVIYIQFDNTHFTRDNPDVPSDLEQMPHLLNFLEQSGVILTNHHTPLISHTANDILTSLTGVSGISIRMEPATWAFRSRTGRRPSLTRPLPRQQTQSTTC